MIITCKNFLVSISHALLGGVGYCMVFLFELMLVMTSTMVVKITKPCPMSFLFVIIQLHFS